jgi:hypothetical protein
MLCRLADIARDVDARCQQLKRLEGGAGHILAARR